MTSLRSPAGEKIRRPRVEHGDRADERVAALGPVPKKGGKASRQKGDRFERAVVKLLNDAGIKAERVPLSGSAGGSFSGDIKAELFGKPFVIEAKARGDGFKQLYDWLSGRDALVLRADRKEALVVVRLSQAGTFLSIPIREPSPHHDASGSSAPSQSLPACRLE